MQICAKVAQKNLDPARIGAVRCAGIMGRDQYVGQTPQRGFARQRLLHEHVEIGAAQPAAGQRFGERCFIDDLAARNIDEPRRARQQREPPPVYNDPPLMRQRAREYKPPPSGQ